jgi:predicted nucleic acid-binding protein
MGLILDSSVLITAEREGQNARQMLAAISSKAGNTDIAISVVTLIELAHGAARADTSQRKEKRQQFIQELLTALPIHPVTVSLALRVGQIDGDNQAKGIRLPLSDLLIGVTALELGYSVATGNLRHFEMMDHLLLSGGWNVHMHILPRFKPQRSNWRLRAVIRRHRCRSQNRQLRQWSCNDRNLAVLLARGSHCNLHVLPKGGEKVHEPFD